MVMLEQFIFTQLLVSGHVPAKELSDLVNNFILSCLAQPISAAKHLMSSVTLKHELKRLHLSKSPA